MRLVRESEELLMWLVREIEVLLVRLVRESEELLMWLVRESAVFLLERCI